MRVWTSPLPERAGAWRRLARCGREGLLSLWLVLAGLTWAMGTARAEDAAAEPAVAVQRTVEGLFITARLPLALGAAVEDALFKAVPGQPIGWRQGLGIMFDDLVAALCALLVLALVGAARDRGVLATLFA